NVGIAALATEVQTQAIEATVAAKALPFANIADYETQRVTGERVGEGLLALTVPDYDTLRFVTIRPGFLSVFGEAPPSDSLGETFGQAFETMLGRYMDALRDPRNAPMPRVREIRVSRSSGSAEIAEVIDGG